MTLPSSLAAYLLALQAVPRVGSWTAVQAARAFPSAEDLLAASDEELVRRLDKRFAAPFISFPADEWPALVIKAQEHIDRHVGLGFRVLTIDDGGYPPLMRLAPRPPAILYARGSAAALETPDTLAVIGTRKPTAAGLEIAGRLTHAMCDAGFTIVSGLAHGIDTAGHEGALDAGGRTVAVLGTSIDKIYPSANRGLAERIEARGGAVVSEYPIGFATSARHFVERDRLQAAMSIGIVAVQTGVQGGTLHTVRFAQEASRLVVVPRPVASEANHEAYAGIKILMHSNSVETLDGVDDYPRLVQLLCERRDRLLSVEVSPHPPSDPVSGDARTRLEPDSEQAGFGF